ncbi:MAG: toxin-antitoxin system, toxin component [Bacteroidales bacterium]|nr:toxin-antitoxin system, toxin component [Candidatus Scybalocola fimicaballi]
MSSEELEKICNNADMIVCGYAFSKTEESNIRIFDLKEPHHALIMSVDGNVLETTMNDVELSIVQEYWKRNQKYLEESYA